MELSGAHDITVTYISAVLRKQVVNLSVNHPWHGAASISSTFIPFRKHILWSGNSFCSYSSFGHHSSPFITPKRYSNMTNLHQPFTLSKHHACSHCIPPAWQFHLGSCTGQPGTINRFAKRKKRKKGKNV